MQYLSASMTQKAYEKIQGINAKVWSNGFRQSAAYWNGEKTFLCYSSASLLNEPSLSDFTFQEEECNEEDIRKREERVGHLLGMIRKPDLVIVSTSQKPIPTSLPDKREELEERIMGALQESKHW